MLGTMISLILAVTAGAKLQDQPIPLQPPMTKSEEKQKYHMPDVRPMPMSVRLKAWEQRQQMVNDALFNTIKWRSVGSEIQSGRVIDIESPSDKPGEMLIAYATGGLYRTTNEGVTFEPIFDGQSAFGIGDFTVSKDGQTIWVGTGENNSQRTSYAGTGVFKSTDGGQTWQNMGLNDSHHVGRVVVHPKNPNVVFVAALGPLYSQGGERGVYRTTDGGKTWSPILTIDKYTGVLDLQMDPRNPDVMYASAWDRDRRAWNMREAGPGSAIYKTTNGGKSWTKLTGIPSGEAMGRAAIGVAPSKPDRVYVFFDGQDMDDRQDEWDEKSPTGQLTLRRFRYMTDEALKDIDTDVLRRFLTGKVKGSASALADDAKAGKVKMEDLKKQMVDNNPSVFEGDERQAQVWRSDDAGKTWKNVSGRMGEHGGYYFNGCFVDPTNADVVYTTGLNLLRSNDGGESWESIGRRNHVDHHVVWIDPKNPKHLFDGNDGGCYVSYDGAASWRHLNSLAVGQFTTLALDNKTPYNIIGGLQDNGTMYGPSNHRSGFSDINNWKAVGGGDGSNVAIDPVNNDIIYTASQFGAHSAQNLATKERWNTRPAGQNLRFNWLSPLIISPHHHDIVYCGSQFLHRSFNNGRKYETISPDLTKGLPAGDVPFSTLTAISESPFKFGRIYTGADDGSLKTTPDGGITWEDIRTPAPDRWVTRIVASKYVAGRVYVTQNGYRQDEWTAYVWRSDDFGKTWKSIADRLPAEPVNTIREDPTLKNVLYVGTDTGVYVSLDTGESWMPYGTGLPTAPVHDLQIQERDKDLVVATHSRSVWVIDTEPIEELDKDLLKTKLKVLPVSSTTRFNWGYERTQPWDKSQPAEPRLTGSFWTNIVGTAKVSLVDKSGKVVKTTEVKTWIGMNNYAIGLRTKDAEKIIPFKPEMAKTGKDALKDPFESKRAQFVPPGTYKIIVEIGGEKSEVEWKLE